MTNFFYKDVTSFENGFISPDSQVQNMFNEAKGSLDTDFYYRIFPKKVVLQSQILPHVSYPDIPTAV